MENFNGVLKKIISFLVDCFIVIIYLCRQYTSTFERTKRRCRWNPGNVQIAQVS
jgi:hypothetical protein